MRNADRQKYFTGFMMVLVVLVMLFVVMPAQAAECEGAHIKACPDITGAEVTFEKIGSTQFVELCGDGADACAVLNVSLKQCTIYYRTRRISTATVDHEMNHCRGWFHKHNRATMYNRPWVDIDTYLGR